MSRIKTASVGLYLLGLFALAVGRIKHDLEHGRGPPTTYEDDPTALSQEERDTFEAIEIGTADPRDE